MYQWKLNLLQSVVVGTVLLAQVSGAQTINDENSNPLTQFYRKTPENWHQEVSSKLSILELAINRDWQNLNRQLIDGGLVPLDQAWSSLKSFRFRFQGDFRAEFSTVIFNERISRLHNVGKLLTSGEIFRLPSLFYIYFLTSDQLPLTTLQQTRWNPLIYNHKTYKLGMTDFKNLISYLAQEPSETQALKTVAGLAVFKLIHKGIVEDLLSQASYTRRNEHLLPFESNLFEQLSEKYITSVEDQINLPLGLEIEEARRGVLPQGPIPWSKWLGLINNKYQVELLDTFQRKVRGATPYFVSRYLPYLKSVNDKLGYELFEKDLELKSTLATDVLGRSGLDFLSFLSDMRRIASTIKVESKEKKDGLFCRLLMLIR